MVQNVTLTGFMSHAKKRFTACLEKGINHTNMRRETKHLYCSVHEAVRKLLLKVRVTSSFFFAEWNWSPQKELAVILAGELIAVIWTADRRRGRLHWDDSNSRRLRCRASPLLITAHSAHSDEGAPLIMGGCSEGATQRLYSVITSYSDRYLH